MQYLYICYSKRTKDQFLRDYETTIFFLFNFIDQYHLNGTAFASGSEI